MQGILPRIYEEASASTHEGLDPYQLDPVLYAQERACAEQEKVLWLEHPEWGCGTVKIEFNDATVDFNNGETATLHGQDLVYRRKCLRAGGYPFRDDKGFWECGKVERVNVNSREQVVYSPYETYVNLGMPDQAIVDSRNRGKEQEGLSTGAKVGIVVGVLGLVGAIAYALSGPSSTDAFAANPAGLFDPRDNQDVQRLRRARPSLFTAIANVREILDSRFNVAQEQRLIFNLLREQGRRGDYGLLIDLIALNPSAVDLSPEHARRFNALVRDFEARPIGANATM